jgi:hypothetical protein
MAFSKQGYATTISKIKAEHDSLPSRLDDFLAEMKSVNFVVRIVEGAAGAATGGVISENTAKEIIQQTMELIERVGVFFEDLVVVPFAMWDAGKTWSSVGTGAGEIASDLAGLFSPYSGEWTGLAAGKYYTGVSLQSAAASRIQSLAQTASSNCFQIAEAGQDFAGQILLSLLSAADSFASLDPGSVAAAIANSIAGIANAYEDTFRNSMESAGMNLQALTEQYGEFPTLNLQSPNGKWPQAVQ